MIVVARCSTLWGTDRRHGDACSPLFRTLKRAVSVGKPELIVCDESVAVACVQLELYEVLRITTSLQASFKV